MQKIRYAMKSSGQLQMIGKVEVDESVLDGKEKGEPSRSRESKKKKIVCAVELTVGKVLD